MAKNLSGCGGCAYVQKEGNKMWCPFHDLPTDASKICDDFLDEYDSPQWLSLAEGINGESGSQSKVPQFTKKDITAYILSIIGILLCVCCFLIGKF